MDPEQPSPARARRKLKRPKQPTRVSSVQYPEKLKEGDDAHEDVTATEGKPAQHMNQSVFSMIAAAGSKVDFNARFEEESSESEDDANAPASLQETDHEHHRQPDQGDQQGSLHRSAMSSKVGAQKDRFPTLPKLNLRTVQEQDCMSQSTILPQRPSPLVADTTPRGAPLLSETLKAQTEVASPEQTDNINTPMPTDLITVDTSTTLVLRLREIFGFEREEDVISGQSIASLAAQSILRLDRVSLLVAPKRSAAGIYVYYCKTYMFLCILAKKICQLTQLNPAIIWTIADTFQESGRQIRTSYQERSVQHYLQAILVRA